MSCLPLARHPENPHRVGSAECAERLNLPTEPLWLKVSGIAASVLHTSVRFSKRFLQCRDLPQLNLPGGELDTPTVSQGHVTRPHDVSMPCKQLCPDARLAQPPLRWIPQSRAALLGRCPTTPQDRSRLSGRTIKEHKNAAVAVVERPWSLHRAGAYLVGWLAHTAARKFAKPPAIPFLLEESP